MQIDRLLGFNGFFVDYSGCAVEKLSFNIYFATLPILPEDSFFR